MFFRQLVDPDLGCACYVLGDAGEAVVVDPGIGVQRILAAAADEQARVVCVLETHVHADHVSGRALLDAEVRVPAGSGAAGRPIAAGDVVRAGAVRIEALAAPGHRPEHLAFLVTDTARCPDPCLLLTGDSLLVGDLARPDLAVDARDGAHALHATLRRLSRLPADLELWPGHVGGSLCGGAGVSPRTSSTLGYERRANALLRCEDADAFADRLIASLPARPPTVGRVVALNRSAVPERRVELEVLDGHRLAPSALVVDGREPEAFDAAHLPGAVNVPLGGRGVGTRAGWLLSSDEELVACADTVDEARELARRLRAVGLDARAILPFGRVGARWVQVPAIAVRDLAWGRGDFTVVDVRDDVEWHSQRLDGAVHVPLSRMRDAEMPAGPLAVACATGKRAATAASWLRRQGHDARRVSGGGIRELVAPAADRAAA